MSAFHEQYGKLVEDHTTLVDAFSKSLDLLKRLKSGEVLLANLTVRDDGWDVEDPKEKKEKGQSVEA